MPTPADLAALMMVELDKRGSGPLSQTFTVRLIREAGGEEYLYKNKQHNWAIKPPVLAAFNKVSGEGVVWSRGSQHWRRRRDYDKPGRMQR